MLSSDTAASVSPSVTLQEKEGRRRVNTLKVTCLSVTQRATFKLLRITASHGINMTGEENYYLILSQACLLTFIAGSGSMEREIHRGGGKNWQIGRSCRGTYLGAVHC